MRILIAPDKFKGSLTARQVADALAAGILRHHGDWSVRTMPVADGGDGTVAAALASGWQSVDVPVEGPTGAPTSGTYARRGSTAIVELAGTAGMALLPKGVPDPLGASTFGLGQAIAHALDNGVEEVIIGLGGSASTDGGAGMLQALGVRIRDPTGCAVRRGGGALLDATQVDLARLHPAVEKTRFLLASDVDNPLLGAAGAVAVYAEQKGAGISEAATLEAAMVNWSEIVCTATGVDHSDDPGAGAAGGTGFGAIALLGASVRPGIELLLDLVGFADAVVDCDLVLTGEGSFDEQSLHGKAPMGVRDAAAAHAIPVLVAAGRSTLTDAAGFAGIRTLAELEPDPRRSIANAAELLETLGARIADELDQSPHR